MAADCRLGILDYVWTDDGQGGPVDLNQFVTQLSSSSSFFIVAKTPLMALIIVTTIK